MPSFSIFGNDTTAKTLSSGQNGFVGVNGALYTETATAVTISGSSSLIVLGTVATAEAAAAVATSATVNTFDLTVGAQGTILSSTTDAMRLAIADNVTMNNAGLISGRFAVYLTGTASATDTTSAYINNSGTILGTGRPDDSSPSGAMTFTASIDHADIVNSGTISGGHLLTAIHHRGETLLVQNSGKILASSGIAYAIVTEGSLDLINTGEIQQGVRAAGSAFIDNSGTIGEDISVFGKLDQVNTGTIHGTVFASE